MIRRSFFLLVIICASFSCFKQEPPLYGPEHNEQRRKLGIPQLPANWAFKGYTPCNTTLYKFLLWTNEFTESRGKPGHTMKDVIYSAMNQLIQEKDTFESGRTFSDVDVSGWEKLEVVYGYETLSDKRSTVCPIDIKKGFTYLYTYDRWTEFKPKHITKQQADSLLTAWHTRRDDY